ncbi:NAD(P)-dependent alcohol dehydrogenase [Ignatzschineria rhizosphaerae]|uniref:NAD(P)-dependent alcohol dehydrogenase n=1 Tax=Ignatzschineria rhizosphaerae TaxID=2923279 RepID=A0ABY3X616_9GAMM|nr:NAD(P)-dependent alcohol dehydrogenase [Ignatzschineria rhizosphaerae]UNM96225.1 NAD(P)-dependent alcohol dehydrogenase [Ignatzschineria rhizosphaerae]
MKVQAAVVRENLKEFSIENLTIRAPQKNEVLVKIVGVGLCHTDLLTKSSPDIFPSPAVLGHEGAGIVEAIGDDITDLNVGDHVVLTFASCGKCPNCLNQQPAYCEQFFKASFTEKEVYQDEHHHPIFGGFFGQSSFATYAIADYRSVVKISKNAPLKLLGPLGCGIQTGAGAIFNTLKPKKGSSIVIFGAGAVGLSALLAAIIAQCSPIIMVDMKEERLSLAKKLGATHTINGSEDVVKKIKALSDDKGVNYTLECTGIPAVLRQAVDVLAFLGTCGVIGAADPKAEVSLNINQILNGKTVRGIIEGDSNPYEFIPQLIKLWEEGKFPFDQFIKEYPLADINLAITETHQGEVIKAVLIP